MLFLPDITKLRDYVACFKLIAYDEKSILFDNIGVLNVSIVVMLEGSVGFHLFQKHSCVQ